VTHDWFWLCRRGKIRSRTVKCIWYYRRITTGIYRSVDDFRQSSWSKPFVFLKTFGKDLMTSDLGCCVYWGNEGQSYNLQTCVELKIVAARKRYDTFTSISYDLDMKHRAVPMPTFAQAGG